MAFHLQIFLSGTPAMDELRYRLYVLLMEWVGYS